MTGTMAIFGMAVGAAPLICYLLMTRSRNRRAITGSSSDSSGVGGDNYSGGEAWSLSSWFGGGHSAIDSSGNPVDFGGGDFGGGGDGGGGGD
jgi:hypothetical protein